jgi:hypothetical protein
MRRMTEREWLAWLVKHNKPLTDKQWASGHAPTAAERARLNPDYRYRR